MANLTTIEKLKLEKLLEMESGYVLDFSNNSFQEFILDNLNVDIYTTKYDFRSGSKANRLRAFWKRESNATVGKLLATLLTYWQTTRELNQQPISASEKQLFQECKAIADRLRGKGDKKEATKPTTAPGFVSRRDALLAEFDAFAGATSHSEKQKRGLLLEGLLARTFALYQIPVEKSFRRNQGGEQIDGAFKLDGWYYLVECKWTQKLTDIRQLDSLMGKLNRSGKQTLGLFLSISGWSKHVVPLLQQNPEKSIILMDGYDLRCVLSRDYDVDLKALLQAKLAHLNFEGQPFYSVRDYLAERATEQEKQGNQ